MATVAVERPSGRFWPPWTEAWLQGSTRACDFFEARARLAAFVGSLVVILGVATWLRLTRLDLVQFTTDDGTVLRLAEDWVRLGRVPLTGMPASVGVPLPPWFIYFVAPFVAISRDPRLATAAVGLANVAGVAGLVVLGWRLFSPLGALVAGLALATDAWAVLYSRRLWPNDVLDPLAVLYFLALDRAVVERRAAWAVVATAVMAVGVQIHFAFGLLAPLLLAPLVMLFRQRRWRTLGGCLGAALLTAIPYLVHLAQTDWADVRRIRDLSNGPALITGHGPAAVMSWVTTWDTNYLGYVHVDRLVPPRLSATAADLQTMLAVVGFIAVALAAGKGARDRRLRMAGLLLWVLVPVVLTIRHTMTVYDHYFPFLAPAGALLIAAAVHRLATREDLVGRGLLGLSLLSLVVVAAIHSYMVVRLLDYVAIRYDDTYGLPLASKEALSDELATFGSRSGALQAAVEDRGPEELGPESGGEAYFLRPYFPDLVLRGVGPIGLGWHAPPPLAPSPTILGAAQQPDLRYPDGVRVLEAVTSRTWTPGQRVRLALTWTVSPDRPGASAPVTWQVRVYDPSGGLVTEPAGGPAEVAGLEPGKISLATFSAETGTGETRVPLRIGLRRIDPGAGDQSPEWRSSPIPVAPPIP